MAYVLSQLHRTGLPPLLQGVETEEEWGRKREGIRRTWLEYIGELPDRAPVRMDTLAKCLQPDHTRLQVVYDTAYGDQVTAYLLLPDERTFPRPEGGYPAMLALHPTHELGKDDIATSAGRKNRMYALELVRLGYVVLVPDALTAGERVYPEHPAFHSGPFYERHPEWSTVAKNATDHMQGLDVLCSLDFVDANAIGAIGHSFGGYNAYFLAGLDDRVKAVVSSCGFSPFAGDPHPDHWGYRDYPYTHIPKISADLAEDRVPFDFHEIAALCAPTPFFNYAGQADAIFPHWKSVAEGMFELSKLYRWLGHEHRFRSYVGAGAHDFPEEIRGLAYAFLDRWVKGKPGVKE
ncbi:prolyl oligopeptidase family serine peptidase [Paenibacillus sp.]|uniref:alpha/beta hydrolase family protein n=1 Tax=Paenibacillus sp. TaxID=58172 RepID=UPI0028118274|nr:prolyl oligopeptidase family serine peptidase [Paenibacillus sp.]